MTIMEAQDLGSDIKRETGAHVEVRQIGNGEWVVLLNSTKYIWGADDWQRLKSEG